MGRLSETANKIREPDKENALSLRSKVIVSGAVMLSGFLLGIFQKWLDGTAVNELPQLFGQIDLTNMFGRFAIWILLAVMISVYAATPVRASVNTFLFFIGMLSGYYLYSSIVLGFLPVSYMLIWVGAAFLSVIAAFVCWYAKGKGIIAVIISAVILGVLLAQAVLFVHGIRIAHLPEVIIWICGAVILRREPKEYLAVLGLSLVTAIIYQLFIPYWG